MVQALVNLFRLLYWMSSLAPSSYISLLVPRYPPASFFSMSSSGIKLLLLLALIFLLNAINFVDFQASSHDGAKWLSSLIEEEDKVSWLTLEKSTPNVFWAVGLGLVLFDSNFKSLCLTELPAKRLKEAVKCAFGELTWANAGRSCPMF